MPQPTPYDRITNFQNDQALAPTDPYPAPSFDAEYNAIKITTDEILQNLALIQRDDGELANDSVGRDQLKDDVYIGFGAPAPWETDYDYVVADTVFQDNAFWYCEVSHHSGVFNDDLAAGFWSLIADFTSAATVGAAMYVSDNAPALPRQGQQWYESDTGNTYLWYVEPGGSDPDGQWIHINGDASGAAAAASAAGVAAAAAAANAAHAAAAAAAMAAEAGATPSGANARLDAGVLAAFEVSQAIRDAVQNIPDNFSPSNFTQLKIQLDALTKAFAALVKAQMRQES